MSIIYLYDRIILVTNDSKTYLSWKINLEIDIKRSPVSEKEKAQSVNDQEITPTKTCVKSHGYQIEK